LGVQKPRFSGSRNFPSIKPLKYVHYIVLEGNHYRLMSRGSIHHKDVHRDAD